MSKLRAWRLERGLSQHELSCASNIARWLIQLFEQGIRSPNPDEFEALASALGVRTRDLISKNSKVQND